MSGSNRQKYRAPALSGIGWETALEETRGTHPPPCMCEAGEDSRYSRLLRAKGDPAAAQYQAEAYDAARYGKAVRVRFRGRHSGIASCLCHASKSNNGAGGFLPGLSNRFCDDGRLRQGRIEFPRYAHDITFRKVGESALLAVGAPELRIDDGPRNGRYRRVSNEHEAVVRDMDLHVRRGLRIDDRAGTEQSNNNARNDDGSRLRS